MADAHVVTNCVNLEGKTHPREKQTFIVLPTTNNPLES